MVRTKLASAFIFAKRQILFVIFNALSLSFRSKHSARLEQRHKSDIFQLLTESKMAASIDQDLYRYVSRLPGDSRLLELI